MGSMVGIIGSLLNILGGFVEDYLHSYEIHVEVFGVKGHIWKLLSSVYTDVCVHVCVCVCREREKEKS